MSAEWLFQKRTRVAVCGINCRREEKEGKEMTGKVRAIVQVKDDKDWSRLWKTELQVVKTENDKEVSFRDTLRHSINTAFSLLISMFKR